MTPFLDDLDSCSLKGLRLSLFFSFLIFFFAWLVGGASVSASWPGAAVLLRGATVCARAPPEASGRRSRGPRRAVAGFHQSSGARGRACSRGEGGESGVLRPLLPSSPWGLVSWFQWHRCRTFGKGRHFSLPGHSRSQCRCSKEGVP